MTFIPVDDHLKLKDSTSEIDIYHIVGNYHMADGVIVHVPASNLLVEADLTTQEWDYNWWGDSLMNNIEYRKIKVDTISPSTPRSRFRLRRSSRRSSDRFATPRYSAVVPPRRSASSRVTLSSTTDRYRRSERHHRTGTLFMRFLRALSAVVVIVGLVVSAALAQQVRRDVPYKTGRSH